MTETPRTDLQCDNNGIGLPLKVVSADFARTLERELSAKQAELEQEQSNVRVLLFDQETLKTQLHNAKCELESLNAAQGWRLDWKPGPQRGGQGTAGMRDGYSLWRDGDILFVLVELVSGECDMAIARVYADGEAHLEVDGNVWDWSVNDISWYAKIGKDALPTPPVEQPPTGEENE